jgi:hypothetical protein
VLQNDYILRMVEQLTQALARILGLKRAGQLAEAEAELDTLARGLVGLDVTALARLPLAALGTVLVEPERRAMAARLLKEHGELVADRDLVTAQAAWRKAFSLLDDLERQGVLPEDAGTAETLTWLVERLP